MTVATSFATPGGASAESSLDGLLPVDKPAGMTSHDVVAQVRKTFRLRKVGHGGTLDPEARGLLILLLGKGTKFSQTVMGGDKTYEGTMRLGISTDTQDGQGKIIATGDWTGIGRQALAAAMSEQTGDFYQVPPMVSAVKIKGVPLYKIARKGKEVERQPRLIHVYHFSITDWAPPLVAFRVVTGKGVYVRTLCHDLGANLGCGAHLQSLRRTKSGRFSIEEAISLEDLLLLDKRGLREKIVPCHLIPPRTGPLAP